MFVAVPDCCDTISAIPSSFITSGRWTSSSSLAYTCWSFDLEGMSSLRPCPLALLRLMVSTRLDEASRQRAVALVAVQRDNIPELNHACVLLGENTPSEIAAPPLKQVKRKTLFDPESVCQRDLTSISIICHFPPSFKYDLSLDTESDRYDREQLYAADVFDVDSVLLLKGQSY